MLNAWFSGSKKLFKNRELFFLWINTLIRRSMARNNLSDISRLKNTTNWGKLTFQSWNGWKITLKSNVSSELQLEYAVWKFKMVEYEHFYQKKNFINIFFPECTLCLAFTSVCTQSQVDNCSEHWWCLLSAVPRLGSSKCQRGRQIDLQRHPSGPPTVCWSFWSFSTSNSRCLTSLQNSNTITPSYTDANF